jgi:hypothetical protein
VKCLGVLGALLISLCVATPALGAATMTYPSDGQTVSLDDHAGFDFRWTLPAGESGPAVYIGDTPSYDPDTLDPFRRICGANDPARVLESCYAGINTDLPPTAGMHYAFVDTVALDSYGDVTAHFQSPVTRFTVPPMIAWGCEAGDLLCHHPVVQSAYDPRPTVGPPESDMNVTGWANSPGAPVNAAFTLRRGSKVVARIRQNTRVDDNGYFDPGFMVFQIGSRGPYRSAVRLHGVRGVKWLHVTIVVHSMGLTLKRTTKFRAPPG